MTLSGLARGGVAPRWRSSPRNRSPGWPRPAWCRPSGTEGRPGRRRPCWPTPWRRSARSAPTRGCASPPLRPGSGCAGWLPGSGCWPRLPATSATAWPPAWPTCSAAGADRVAIVGADTPHVPTTSYRRAFALLEQADVVLGPALDGGYYLVAAKAARPELFVGIPMGTDTVLSETLARATRDGLVVALLPPLRDLDRVEDLAAALAAGDLAGAPATLAAATELLAERGVGDG